MLPGKDTITVNFTENNICSTAVYSPCKKYRYLLTRARFKSKKNILFILLNPSTATELKNDPTIARCQKRAELLGFKAFSICNLFAFRTKSPLIMKSSIDPIGPANDKIIKKSLCSADKVICAWGNHGSHLNRADTVLNIIRASGTPSYHLGLTIKSQPTHPLYLQYDVSPTKW